MFCEPDNSSRTKEQHCGLLIFEGYPGAPNRSLAAFQTVMAILIMRVSWKIRLVWDRWMMSLGLRCEKI